MSDETDQPRPRSRTPIFRLDEIADDAPDETGDGAPLYFAGGAPFTREVDGVLMSPVFSQAQLDALRKLRASPPAPMFSMGFMAVWLIGAIAVSIAVGIPMHSLTFVILLAAGLPLAFFLLFQRQKRYLARVEAARDALWDHHAPVAVPEAFASDDAWEVADQYF